MKRTEMCSDTNPESDGDEPGGPPRYSLQLFVTGTTALSTRAIVNIRRICEDHLKGHYDLEVVDISIHPGAASAQQIIAAPTLLKKSPLPSRRFIGDMSQTQRILNGLGMPCAAADGK